ncbi:dnaJ homolog subfamily B member 13-like [Oryza brachyantha]|uniref:dnaJ homolog subfamily B member 13-like n=1 Tax=Oryza brachyantha TaxID=4533 RepID=UPI001ADA0B5B|nr:dnaJ homolog subfamily B member 13-like [Oryza brachyantha]
MGNPPELYYEILNISRDTPPKEIRAAYKTLVRQWHPDKHPPSSKNEAEARFKAITEAYEALLDQQENRAVFGARSNVADGKRDKTAERAAAAADAGGGGGAATTTTTTGGRAAAMPRAHSEKKASPAPCTPVREFKKPVYSSTDLGGGGGCGRRAFAEFSSYVVRKAPALERKVECTLEELCTGCKKEVKYTRDVVTKTGLISKKEETKTIRVRPGWKKGMKVTFEGMGDERPGCLPGDAVFTISERKHKVFKRKGNDLVLKAEVPLASALTGWSFSFRLIGGEKMSYSFRDEVIFPGYEKVVAGEGMPVAGGERGARGDLRVKFDVVFPKNLTDEQRAGLASILRACP